MDPDPEHCWRVFSFFACELDARARYVGEDGGREAPRHPHQQDGRPHRQLGCQEVGTILCFGSGSRIRFCNKQDGRPHRQLGCQEVGTFHSFGHCFVSRSRIRFCNQQDGRPHRQLGCQEVGTLHSVVLCFGSGSTLC